MSEKDNDSTDEELPNLPEKLSERIEEVDAEPTDEPIFTNGRRTLNSDNPVRVVEFYLETMESEWSKATFRDKSYDLTRFLEYCEAAGIDDLSELSEQDLQGLHDWRKQDENINLTSLHGQLADIRVFLRWCEKAEVISDELADEMEIPDEEDIDDVSYVRIDAEEANRIIEYHQQYPYVTRAFAEFVVMWAGLCRLGDVRSLDLDNYDRDGGYIELEHDLDEETPLKNGESDGDTEHGGGEREVNLPNWACDVLNRYIDGTGDDQHPQRISGTDDYGRQPIFTTERGRISKSTLRKDLYRITQPCRYGRECPYDKDPDSCEARNDYDLLSQCPSSVSPHPVRRGGICDQIKRGVDKDIICNRADVSRPVLDKHYDIRSREEAREQRREELKKVLDGYEEPEELRPTTWQEQIPVLYDVTRMKRRAEKHWNDPSTRTRLVKGFAGYAVFVALVAVNFGFLGIGIDPVSWEVVVSPW